MWLGDRPVCNNVGREHHQKSSILDTQFRSKLVTSCSVLNLDYIRCSPPVWQIAEGSLSHILIPVTLWHNVGWTVFSWYPKVSSKHNKPSAELLHFTAYSNALVLGRIADKRVILTDWKFTSSNTVSWNWFSYTGGTNENQFPVVCGACSLRKQNTNRTVKCVSFRPKVYPILSSILVPQLG